MILLDKEYQGFEDWADIERDVNDSIEYSGIPAEGRGVIKIKIEYIEEVEDDEN